MRVRKWTGMFMAGILCCSMLLSGCGAEKNPLMDYRADISSGGSADETETNTEEYLSQGICVIPKKEQTQTADQEMTSRASLMINDSDNEMLYSWNIYKKIYPASITKIITAYVTLKYANLDDVVTVSYNASHITEYGAKLCGFAEGDRIVLRDLLYSFLICSGNDAGIAIAEHVAGSVKEFAKLMNKEMRAIGAVHSHFVNPHGLHDDKHYTTAYDLYLVFHRLIQNETFLDIVNRGTYTANFYGKDGKSKKLSFLSTDRYLIGRAYAPDGITVIGGKTGTTYNAGSCLILYSRDSQNKGYISVVLKAQGGDDLYRQMNHLLSLAVTGK